MRRMIIAALAIWASASTVEARQAGANARFTAFNQAFGGRGDCAGYQTIADEALTGRPEEPLNARVSANAAICAALDGRFDLTDRLAAHFPTSAQPGSRDFLVSSPYRSMIQRLVDIPGAGPSALAAARRWPDIDPLSSPNVAGVELTAMALFAAEADDEGRAVLAETGRTTAPSVQLDRRFGPAWLTPAELATETQTPPAPSKAVTADAWRLRLIALERQGDETAMLAAATQAMRDDIDDTQPFGLAFGHLGSSGLAQRAWIVQRHLDAGRIDDALAALDVALTAKAPALWDFRIQEVVENLAAAMILADRPDDARKLLDWLIRTRAADRAGSEARTGSDDPYQAMNALRACVDGDRSSTLGPSYWRTALVCDYPEDRTAALLVAALETPLYRGQVLQALSLTSTYPPLGKAEVDYRERWDRLLQRPDVATTIARYGRRIPAATAWRLSRANLPF